MKSRKSFAEELRTQFDSLQEVNEEVNLVRDNPVEYLNQSYEALTEDLDKKKIVAEPFSRDGVISTVLKNQARYLMEITQSNLPSGQDFTFTTLSMPLVRKIFSKLIAMELVTVQPISQPTAKIFYLDFQRDDNSSLAEVKSTSYADSEEAPASVKEIDMKLTSESISAINEKLKAIWTVEAEQDLMAYQGLAIESELMSAMQEEIVREIDGKIIAALIAGATGTGTGTGVGAGNVTWSATSALAGDTSTIYEAIIDASNLIFKKRYRYANWILGGPDAIARLEKLEDFKLSEGADAYEFTVGRHLIGTLGSRFKVYKDPFYPNNNQLLLGYKGTMWADSVGYYAPYIPLYTTPKIIDPNDFKPRRGLMSRFAYGTLIKNGLATVTITAS
jgi:hypothetical protein